MEDMRQFLEAMETMGPGLLFEEGGKEGWENIDPNKKAALEAAGIKALWPYEPEGYDLIVLEHGKDGEQKNSWSVVFFAEAAAGQKEAPVLDVGEDLVYEAKPMKTVKKILDQAKGNFLYTVQLCIELASNKSMKTGFTAQKVQQAVSAAKKGGGAVKGGGGGKSLAKGKPPQEPIEKRAGKPYADEREEEEEE